MTSAQKIKAKNLRQGDVLGGTVLRQVASVRVVTNDPHHNDNVYVTLTDGRTTNFTPMQNVTVNARAAA